MASSFFSDIISPQFNPGAVLDISPGSAARNGKVLIISDFHMGSGRRDDLHPNGEILKRVLEDYYFKDGWHLVLNGDIEELAKFSLKDIRAEWAGLYRVFDRFAAEGRLYKTLGNHDEDLIFERRYPYPLYNAIRIETGLIPIYVYHGHQSSRVYTDFKNLILLSLRYLFKPLGIRNIYSARSHHRRFHVVRQA
ncbi:MAG: metallophosphatase family protein [Treponema sp.]|jgi:metallophosphoesterase superfamily enzyme|nr:metallophosphatase family protein [Treponema sp.]